MFKLRDISIRNKLILMQVFTSVLVLGIFFMVYVITDIKSYKERKVNNMMSLAQVIGTNSLSTLQFQDNEAANNILSELQNGAPDIIHAGIVYKDGKLFASYAKPGTGSFQIPAALQNKKYLFSGQHLYVSHDILNEKKVAGKVILEVGLMELQQIKKSKLSLAIILLIIALGFSFLIALFIQTYISRRLLHVVNTMDEVSKTGNYSKKIKERGKDEIGTLSRVFNNLMHEVKESQQRKDEFIGIASHELKTPLTSIKGYVELLKEMEDNPVHRQVVQKVLENSIKLEKLIKDLLDVAKIQSGQLELTMKEFDIKELLQTSVPDLQMVSKTHKIILEDFTSTEMILADKQKLEQVLINLVSNAVKYSPGEKKVIISCNKNEEELIIRIRDFGIGVPIEEQANIFDRFYRTKETAASFSGFGLGLYICRDIIKRHNGRIWIDGEEKGSSFCFSLPKLKPTAN